MYSVILQCELELRKSNYSVNHANYNYYKYEQFKIQSLYKGGNKLISYFYSILLNKLCATDKKDVLEFMYMVLT